MLEDWPYFMHRAFCGVSSTEGNAMQLSEAFRCKTKTKSDSSYPHILVISTQWNSGTTDDHTDKQSIRHWTPQRLMLIA